MAKISRSSWSTPAFAALALALSACGDGESGGTTAGSNEIAEDPFGATGAPGSDLTDNGASDGASGLADNNQAQEPLSEESNLTQ